MLARTPHAGRYRLVTSRAASGGQTRKQVDVDAGETLTICRLEGAGRIARFWMTVPLIGQRHVLEDVVLRMYWDGERSPSVETPLGDFFGASFGKARRLVSERLVIAGGAFLCRFEMPFNQGAVLQVDNQSPRPIRNLFFQVGYYDEPGRTEREPTLHAQYRRERPTRAGVPVAVASARGEGWFAGFTMAAQNRSWWLRPPFKEMAIPRGLGLGLLEGWETITVDETDKHQGTGAEDYFSGGFYFAGGPFCTPTHGCTARSFLTGRASAYRFHVDDLIPFERSFEMTLDHGLGNTMQGDYTTVAYWYQAEPHQPFSTLPSVGERRARTPWINPAQWLVCAGVAAAGCGLLLALLLR
jgi:hypothetical protein